MTTPNADYRVRTATHKSAVAAPKAPDPALVDFLQLLARAARQLHTYPSTSPLCVEAIDACQRAFVFFDTGPLACRVTPAALVIDDVEVGGGTIVEQELARVLHRARVASIEIDRTASRRDWVQFCAALHHCQRSPLSKTTPADVLIDAGVTAIALRMSPRPEVLALGAPPAPVRDLVARERSRQQALGPSGPSQYFYPPDKGWVRLDPSVPYESVSLLDLTLLVDDPAELASILMRLTDDDEAGEARDGALEQKYTDVVTLIGALDPRLARLLFGRLSRAVLDLDSDRRRALLKRAILPGLMDGRIDGEAVLSEFPEVDLADALCLLLDLETAAPELLSAALDRLNLPAERRDAIVPLIEARLQSGSGGSDFARRFDAGLDRYAGALVRVDAASGQNFAEYEAFGLAMDEQTTAAIAVVRETIATADGVDAQLTCLTGLIRLEPNPTRAAELLERALPLLRTLPRARRWNQLAVWIGRFREIDASLHETRPEIAAAIRDAFTRLCDRQVLLPLADFCGTGEEERTTGRAIVAGFGRALVPGWLAALESAVDRPRVRSLSQLMAERARDLGPAVAKRLPRCGPDALRSALTLLGFAGGGYERVIADQLAAGDERTLREALLALARIGTTQAAALVADQLQHGPAPASSMAEDALWRLPAPVALVKARELLGRREFVTSRPQIAGRLLDRAARSADQDLGPVLEGLARLRYHFWDPAVMRVAARARELMS